MKLVFGILCLVAVCYSTYVPISSVENEAYEILNAVIPVIQTDSKQFGELTNQFKNAKSSFVQLELVPQFIQNYENSYQVFAKQFHQIASFTSHLELKAKNSSSNEMIAPRKLVNLFMVTVEQIAEYLDYVDTDLSNLKSAFKNLIITWPSLPTQQDGTHLIPQSTVNLIVSIINKIAKVNELITAETKSAVSIAENDLAQYIVNSKSLEPSMGLLSEVLKEIGQYIGDFTNQISLKIKNLTNKLPITQINSQEDTINSEQLIAKVECFFQYCHNIYQSLIKALEACDQILPIGIAALSALN